jgi:hypothetical protein
VFLHRDPNLPRRAVWAVIIGHLNRVRGQEVTLRIQTQGAYNLRSRAPPVTECLLKRLFQLLPLLFRCRLAGIRLLRCNRRNGKRSQ